MQVLRSPRYARAHDLWVFDNFPHSCSATGGRFPTAAQAADKGGYLPLWSAALENRTDAITASLWVRPLA